MFDAYQHSGALARACPPIRLSKPTPLDNTASQLRASGTVEPAREVACWACDGVVHAGKGIQVPHNGLLPIIHPECLRLL